MILQIFAVNCFQKLQTITKLIRHTLNLNQRPKQLNSLSILCELLEQAVRKARNLHQNCVDCFLCQL